MWFIGDVEWCNADAHSDVCNMNNIDIIPCSGQPLYRLALECLHDDSKPEVGIWSGSRCVRRGFSVDSNRLSQFLRWRSQTGSSYVVELLFRMLDF